MEPPNPFFFRSVVSVGDGGNLLWGQEQEFRHKMWANWAEPRASINLGPTLKGLGREGVMVSWFVWVYVDPQEHIH